MPSRRQREQRERDEQAASARVHTPPDAAVVDPQSLNEQEDGQEDEYVDGNDGSGFEHEGWNYDGSELLAKQEEIQERVSSMESRIDSRMDMMMNMLEQIQKPLKQLMDRAAAPPSDPRVIPPVIPPAPTTQTRHSPHARHPPPAPPHPLYLQHPTRYYPSGARRPLSRTSTSPSSQNAGTPPPGTNPRTPPPLEPPTVPPFTPLANPGSRNPVYSTAFNGLRVQQTKEYDGPQIEMGPGKFFSLKHLLIVLKKLVAYRYEKGQHIRLVEVMNDAAKESALATLQTRDGYADCRYEMEHLQVESEGRVIEALIKNLLPQTRESYQKMLGSVKHVPIGSTLVTRFDIEVYQSIIKYTDDFVAMWSILRFNSDVYDQHQLLAQSNPLTMWSNSSMYGACSEPSEFEPGLLHASEKTPKSNKKSFSSDQLLGLISIFLDGIQDKLGTELYQLMHFHTGESTTHPEMSLKGKKFLEFVDMWKRTLYTINIQVRDVAPIVRALSHVNKKETDNPRASRFPPRGHPALVNSVDEATPLDIHAVEGRSNGQTPMSAVRKVGFCLSFVTGQACRQGKDCPFDHTQAAFIEFRKAINAFDGRMGAWAPSSERRQQLVSSALKVKPYGPPLSGSPTRIVPRPAGITVNEVEALCSDPMCDDLYFTSNDSDEDELEEWHRQQLDADDLDTY